MMKVLTFLLLLAFNLQANPWGKDADLVNFKVSAEPPPSSRCSTPMMGKFAETMIGFYQTIISPAKGPTSNFVPGSSQYTLDAMRKYGFFRGFLMGSDRLMRENPESWVYKTIDIGQGKEMKWDPVR